ncbi:MAG: DUF2029 domain-containing protein [Candidatus Omnitrophica bacterium]|nr:DUF2029 domain-containing protein [Candidatus Omnitrophota bacterium]
MIFRKFCISQRPYPWVITVSMILGFLLAPVIFSNIKNISNAFISRVDRKTTPEPLYGFLQPFSYNSAFWDMSFALDFAGVYYRAKNFDRGDIYTNRNYDILGRPLLYSPIICYLYSKTFCKLPYSTAVLFHIFFQCILLLIATYLVLRYYKLELLIIPFILIYSILLFLTPVGLSWFERGQFEIYPALAILFFMFAVQESKGYAFVISAIFASLKWTLAPFFIQAFVIYFFLSRDKDKIKFCLMFAAVIVLTLVFFPYYLKDYLTILTQAQSFSAEGISLVSRMPSYVISLIPLITLGVYLIPLCLNYKRIKSHNTFLPYMTSLVTINMLLPSITYEYRIVCLIGFLPMTIPWVIKYKEDRLFQIEFISLLTIFMFVAFHGFWMISESFPPMEYMISAYFAFYLAISTICIPRLMPN